MVKGLNRDDKGLGVDGMGRYHKRGVIKRGVGIHSESIGRILVGWGRRHTNAGDGSLAKACPPNIQLGEKLRSEHLLLAGKLRTETVDLSNRWEPRVTFSP
eukprot:1189364-Prorocentrum_minimum.AAC.3